MKWFQVDADTPNDPKIAEVEQQLGLEGLGALFRLWCFIADHGSRRPGWSIEASGRPIPVEAIAHASRLPREKFDALVAICVANGHFSRAAWEKSAVIAIPAMSRRADTYTKRRVRTGVRTKFVNKTVHTKQTKPPVVPLEGGRVTRDERQRAREIRRQRLGCTHTPRCSSAKTCLERIVGEIRANAS